MKRIAIVCGGYSSEYGVSLRSAQGLYSFFDKERYELSIVELKGSPAAIDWSQYDYAYITIHGVPGENGELQGFFDMIGMPYSTSGVLVEALTFNKFALNNYLRAFGVNVAPSILVRKGEERPSDEAIIAQLGLPCFVMPAADGSSYGVTKVKSPDQLPAALALAFTEDDEVMIEGFLSGTEISQGVYKTKDKTVVLPATEVVTANEFFDYDAKYNGQVEEITPARLAPATAQRVASETSRIYDILHCNGIIRVDYIITKDADGQDIVNMLEVNTTPGMTATSFIPQQVRAAGLNIADVLTDVVENTPEKKPKYTNS